MEFFTTSIAQRTRQRTLKFHGLDKVNGSKEMASRSKEDSIKGSRKSVPVSKKYCDVVEIDINQFKKDLGSSKTSCDANSYARSSSHTRENGLDRMDVEMENSRSFKDKGVNQEPKWGKDYRPGRKGVSSSSKRYSRKGIKKPASGSKKHPIVIEISRAQFLREVQFRKSYYAATSSKQNTRGSLPLVDTSDNGFDHMNFITENSSFSVSLESRSLEDEGTDEDVKEFSKYDGKATKREEVIKTKSNYFNDLEVGETSGNYCKGENVGASRRVRNNTKVEEFVVSSGDDLDEFSSYSDSESEDSNDSDNFVDVDSPSTSVVESSSDSEEVDEENETKELVLEKENGDYEDEKESVEKQSLKRKQVSTRMKHGLMRKKRGTDSDEIQENSDFGDEPTKKSKDKSEKKSREIGNILLRERENDDNVDKHALKRKKILGRKNHKQIVSSCRSNEEEAGTISDGMHENTSFCDSDDKPIKSVIRKEAEVRKPTERNGSNARTECSIQIGESSLKRKSCYSETRISGQKDDVLGNLLKGILGKGDTDEGEDLLENINVKPLPVKESNLLKFRFNDEDEFPPEKEKDEFELMVDGLFEELAYGLLQGNEEGFSGPPTEDDIQEDEENQYDRCCKGYHDELYFDEEIGIRCYCCKDIIVESKYVLPDLVTPTTETSRRRNSWREKEFPRFKNLVLEGSGSDSLESCNHSKGTIWDIVPGIREQMYPHQQEGIEFLWQNLAGTINIPKLINSDFSGRGGCIISHAPGTGKTRLTIVFLETFLKLFPNSRPVIIAPVSIILTWEEEFKKWKVKFPFHNLNNPTSSSGENLCKDKDLLRVVKMHAWKKGGSVLGVSYSLFEKLAGYKFTKDKGKKNKREKVVIDKNLEMLRSILLEMPGLVVLDEGHIPRNQTSSIWNALSSLKTEKCIILSGTPFQNNFEELFNTLSLVRPAIADKLAREKAYDMQSKENGICLNSTRLDQAIEKLKAEIAPFVHVHKGSILQKNLPGLRDCVVILSPAPLQKHLIESMEKSQRHNTFEYEHKVAMVSVHPSLLLHCGNLSEKEKSYFDQKELEKLRLDYDRGVKTKFVMELIRLSVALGEKVLIFSQYVQPLVLIKDHLNTVFNWYDGKQVFHMRGNLDQKQRQKLINIFNDPKSEAKVMLASIKCCSEGIHLVGASRVVLLDVVWNPSVERQAICRAYRLGQKKVVYTYHLMAFGTSEGEKYCRQAQKDRISELVFSGSSSSSKTTEEGTEKQKDSLLQLDDNILEDMVGHKRLKQMFKKIIYQPRETNFFESFSSESFL